MITGRTVNTAIAVICMLLFWLAAIAACLR